MFFAKKKKNVLNVRINSRYYSENINELIAKTRVPGWFKDIKPITDHPDTRFNLADKFPESDFVFGTVKSCPGIIDIFTNSYSLLSPCDFTIKIDHDNQTWQWISPWNRLDISGHNLDAQTGPNSVLTKNYINLKINIPAWITSNKKCRIVYLPPIYHNYSRLTTLIGTAPVNPKIGVQLNVNTIIDKNGKNGAEFIEFKKGDVLAYMYSPDLMFDEINATYNSSDEIYEEKMLFKNDFARRGAT